MATSFAAAALGAEGLAADVTMLIGNGYLPGHAEYALRLLREEPGVRGLFEGRLAAGGAEPISAGGAESISAGGAESISASGGAARMGRDWRP
jgi:hypothetical protein